MAPHDVIIDDDEDCCPLCVEEFDLSDKNFRPCPCGYQVCQFCFNNIKTNMNGLCPACRRPYDEKTIEWKVVTPEEVALFKANVQKNAKKKQEQRQKEAQKREVESLNRKHLSGLRVVQKNLVYVVGLSPNIAEKEILETLRGDKYFGQYGKIIKIVVSNKKDSGISGQPQSLGVYVTFARKEDAARCIAAVNGSQNGDRVLRAQLGTTKYCSAYLRNETCTNKNCMFLHEPGDNDDSYSRQDLSSINSVNTQRPLPVAGPSSSTVRQVSQAQAHAPLQQAQPIAAAAQPMIRDNSKDGSESGDGSALPSSASWAHRGVQENSRRGSQCTSGAASSPAISQAVPARTETMDEPQQDPSPQLSNALLSSDTVSSMEPAGPERDPLLVDILRAINASEVSFSRPISTEVEATLFSAFPPLFDDFGGEKRRAMRNQQEEARLHLEQDSQVVLHSVPEPVEEEAPESGSLQLGGEPEDIDNGREGSIPQNYHSQRRPSSQVPIHRGSNGGPFGPSLSQNFPHQNIGSLSSINGRTLTAHQQNQFAMLKSSQAQAGFMDPYPPGMGNLAQGGGLFQQQGHNRQSSRYNFANDGSSTSSSVKPSANPKLMAQQSSMMPSVNHGSQFYGSSMPGPPPGLKSTATPPIGGMFGQGHGFGGSMAGSSLFGGMTKGNNTEFLRDMLDRGGRVNTGGQSHDTGKREYNFSPSFPQQYPSASSTPAPASGFLASLYGQQTGAFQDFAQKQKKKGKKHRHANTSSSGGGGIVDLPDPSILQARMLHQQQSNAGVGQGLFGGQAQDDYGLPSLDEATSSVDALVADDDSIPPSLNNSNQVSRSSTPTVPPGFSVPHAHPAPSLREEPGVKAPSRFVPTSAPFTPSRVSANPRVATPLSIVSVPPTPQSAAKPKVAAPISQAKQDVKALATDTGLSKVIAIQSQPTLQSEDFPALDSGKIKVPLTPSKPTIQPKAAPAAKTSKKQSTPQVSSASAVTETPAKLTDKRPAQTLNITVPTKPSSKIIAAEKSTPVKPESTTAFPPLPVSTPGAAQSPLARPAPKTLRVTSTPKTENSPAGNVAPLSSTSIFPPSRLPASRQPSLASISRLDCPGTPSSEIISDNASITSASISRANSPPPSKVGSAPVRSTTKSMAKKQRQQRGKGEDEKEALVTKVEPQPDIGPIIGRKKKQKKEPKERTVHSAAGGSTPIASRPVSPSPVESKVNEGAVRSAAKEQVAQVSHKSSPIEIESSKFSRQDSKGKGKAKMQSNMLSPDLLSPAPEVEDEIVEKSIPTPAMIFQELLAEGVIGDTNSLSLLKNPATAHRFETPIDPQSIHQKLTISPEDRAALLAGKAVQKVAEGPNRIMLTPNGDCIRNLTPEEEQKYLDLQARIASEYGPTSFISAKHHASNGFALIGGRAVPNGPPSFFPVTNNGTPAMDPVSKIQRDEALSYINQYVLPSLSTNSQLEKALNANALDSEIGRSEDHAAWSTWGTDANAPRPENGHEAAYNASNRDGMIATGIEHMTAHFAIGNGGELNRGQPLGNVSLLSYSESESAMQIARKETEGLEKKLNALIKKNRRLLLPGGH
ncbi:related to MOT2-transcriptional repressor [Rhynchosporium secalis]|uniref:Related to MOT2-transcriptional repressor n=1 Tax=Rhynchosporium secalis TaxID=38038 RepID=A0A1E1MAU1_RHYSE|nr:related to MOT2-transcriptional repressor [Rhynchosporium secalis]